MPVPIFASPLVDREKGTGILMVCTFGDATDVQWWREEGLPLRQVVGRNGRLSEVEFGTDVFPSLDPEAANRYYGEIVGRTVREAQKTIVERLREPEGRAHDGDGAPLVGEPEPIEHPVKFYEKGDRPLEFVSTRQWFVRLLDRRQELIDAGERIVWHPDFMRLRFRIWTENLRLDWCISRQRYFGVPFPLWYPLLEDGSRDYSRPILADEKALPVDPATDVAPGYDEGQRDQPGGFAAEPDIFDTWFTSSLTPQIATGWFEDPQRHRRLFPMDLRPQSHEIIRTWAFYTIAKAWLHEETIPWSHVAISGWVLDPDRKKMSKSKGNVVTPMHLLDQYGSDAVRYWSLSARLGTDTAFDEKVLKVGRRLVTKVFNASKFVLSQSAPEGPVVHPLDLSFLARLQETVEKASASLEALDYAAALDTIERFFWAGFTDTYVEMVKSRARSESDEAGRASAVAALQLALKVLLRLLAPYLPYVTEEAWSWGFAQSEGAPSIHRAPWPSDREFAGLPPVAGRGAAFDAGCAFLEAVRKAKSGAGATVGRHLARLRIAASPTTARLVEPCLGDLVAAARAEGEILEVREGLADGSFEVVEIELAEARPRG